MKLEQEYSYVAESPKSEVILFWDGQAGKMFAGRDIAVNNLYDCGRDFRDFVRAVSDPQAEARVLLIT